MKKKYTEEEILNFIKNKGLGTSTTNIGLDIDSVTLEQLNDIFIEAFKKKKLNKTTQIFDSVTIHMDKKVNKIYLIKGLDKDVLDRITGLNEQQKVELTKTIEELQNLFHLNFFCDEKEFYSRLFYPESMHSIIPPFILFLFSNVQITKVNIGSVIDERAQVSLTFEDLAFKDKIKNREIELWLFIIKWKYFKKIPDINEEINALNKLFTVI